MSPTRRRFSGTMNVLRFNRGKFVAAAVAVVALTTTAMLVASVRTPSLIGAALVVIGVVASLGVSYWVYDASDLYDFEWSYAFQDHDRVAVVHAGLDEVSETLQARHGSDFHTVSFYNRLEVSGPSIRQARRLNDTADTGSADPNQPLIAIGRFDWVVAFMCLHEVRSEHARQRLLTELRDGLAEGGKLVVVEHLRDLPNAAGFSIGVFHFLSRSSWSADFAAAGLQIVSEEKTTPFVSEFVLSRGPQA